MGNYKIGEVLVKLGIRTKPQVTEALHKQKSIKKQKKKVPAVGTILRLSKEDKDKALNFQGLCRAMEPHLPYPGTNTVFGESLTKYVQDKYAVTLYVTRGHSLVNEDDKVFISDGSHGYFLFLALVFRKHKIDIVTNNIGVAGEYVLRSGETNSLSFPSNGIVVANYGGLFKFQAESLNSEMEHANIFISVEILDHAEGPCLDSRRADVRRAAFASGSKVTILADYHTLSHNPEHHAKIFEGDHIETWHNWLNCNHARIVTTTHPRMPDSELMLRPDKRTPKSISKDEQHTWRRYSQNSRQLYQIMKDRFIEVDKDGYKLKYSNK